jgi:hypothetical protein
LIGSQFILSESLRFIFRDTQAVAVARAEFALCARIQAFFSRLFEQLDRLDWILINAPTLEITFCKLATRQRDRMEKPKKKKKKKKK